MLLMLQKMETLTESERSVWCGEQQEDGAKQRRLRVGTGSCRVWSADPPSMSNIPPGSRMDGEFQFSTMLWNKYVQFHEILSF